jgi:hypothetical protein
VQLKIQRSQRAGGITGGKVFFCLDVRADYSSEEQSNIRKYGLGSQHLYNSRAAKQHLDNASTHLSRTQSGDLKNRAAGLARGALSLAMSQMTLHITIDSLGRGHHIECKDLEELLETEDTVCSACKNLTRYLDVATTFNGSETVIEYEKGEERIHVVQASPPLLAYAAAGSASSPGAMNTETGGFAPSPNTPAFDLGERISELWNNPQSRKFFYIGGGIFFVFLFIHSCT